MQTTQAPAAPRRLLLLKAKIAHTAGAYLLNGRWHKIKENKPVPKGVPVAAHPHAAGNHLPVKHFTDEQWNQLKLPPENSNAGTYNKQLEQLKEHSEAGNVTAIVGSGYGVNTYGQKLAKIANALLGMHSSPHQVTPGQKPGEHDAVKTPVAAAAPAATQTVSEPPSENEWNKKVIADSVAENDKLTIENLIAYYEADGKDSAEDQIVTTYAKEALAFLEKEENRTKTPEVQPAPAATQSASGSGPHFDDSFGKAAYYNKLADKLEIAASIGPEALTVAFKTLSGAAVAGKTKNSKILLAYHEQLAATQTPTKKPAPAPVSPKPQAAHQEPANTTEPIQAASKLAQIPWEAMKLPATNTNAGTFNKKIDEIKAAAVAGDLAKLEGMKFGVNTYGKKAQKIAATAIAALKESAPEPVAPEPVAPPAQAEKLTVPLTSLTKEQFDSIASYAKYNGHDAVTKFAEGKKALESLSSSDQSKMIDVIYGYSTPSEVGLNFPEDGGPNDGDTKPGADGTLVFKDGHWHKQEEAKPSAAPTGLDAIAIPDFGSISPGKHGTAYSAIAQQLLDTVKQEGIGGIKGNITKHKTGKFTIKAAGWQIKHVGPNDPTGDPIAKARRAAMHKFVTELYATAPKAKKAPKPKVAPALSPAPQPAASPSNGMPAIDKWEQTGPQGGSNPGGKFKDENGVEWYCKFPADEDVAKSEVLASKLYAAAGISGQDAKLVTQGGKVGIASRWTTVSKAASPSKLAKVDGVQQGFAVDAWLGNWDVVGLEYDNLQVGADGKAIRVDAGGSLNYRAQGGKKAFGNSVIEIDSLRDKSINPQAAAVFGKMTQADIAASASKVANLSDTSIRILVNTYGPGDDKAKQELADTLIARKADIIAKYPKAKKDKVITFKPEKISAPPSFTNWGGSGKSGPSSKEFLNQANEKAVQAIYEAAKSGKVEVVQNLAADVFNKDTGDVTGSAKVLEHPSQHVKGYAQQAINEINYQYNPPKRFRFDGGHPLHSLNAAYPSHKGPLHSVAAGKLAKFVLLGEPGTVSLEALALPKKTYNSGQLTQKTYAAVAQQAFSKMPETQKQAIQSYTGSGYGSMNSSLWDGNPSGKAKAAGEALHALGHTIEPGHVLSRKVSVHGADLDQILKSTGKVLQEPAIMSTSIRPTSWSGNVHLKMHVGPGVKGLWVGKGSQPGGGSISNHSGEDEIILPPNTRLLVLSTTLSKGTDADGFGTPGTYIVEAVILPTQDHA